MTEQFTRETNQFHVEDDDGAPDVVVEYQAFIRFTPVAQGTQTIPGNKHYELRGGIPVDCLPDGTFKVIHSGKILRKV